MNQQVDERVAFLRQVPFFKDMLMKELEVVGLRCRLKTYVQDSIIFSEGMPGKGLHILRKGVVVVVKRLHSGEKVMGRLKEPDMFGEISLLDRAPISASVRAAEDCECLVMEQEVFDELLSNDPVVGTQLLLVIGRVLAHLIRRGNAQDFYGAL